MSLLARSFTNTCFKSSLGLSTGSTSKCILSIKNAAKLAVSSESLHFFISRSDMSEISESLKIETLFSDRRAMIAYLIYRRISSISFLNMFARPLKSVISLSYWDPSRILTPKDSWTSQTSASGHLFSSMLSRLLNRLCVVSP